MNRPSESQVPSPTSRTSRGYDRLARLYVTIERLRFGWKLDHWRMQLLRELPASQNTLVLGDGDGRFLHALVSQLVAERVTCASRRPKLTSVDISRQMLRLQEQRISPMFNEIDAAFLQADILSTTLPESTFQLVTALFFLDCFEKEELGLVLAKIVHSLRPNGWVYIVDFHDPSAATGCRGLWVRSWLHIMHACFRWTTGLQQRTLLPLDPLLSDAGFVLKKQRFDRLGWLRASLWQLNG